MNAIKQISSVLIRVLEFGSFVHGNAIT
jgi:hypothetical protein